MTTFFPKLPDPILNLVPIANRGHFSRLWIEANSSARRRLNGRNPDRCSGQGFLELQLISILDCDPSEASQQVAQASKGHTEED